MESKSPGIMNILRERPLLSGIAVLAAGGLALVGLNRESTAAPQSLATPGATETFADNQNDNASDVDAGVLDPAAFNNAVANPDNDTTLRAGNYACGGEKVATSTDEFAYLADFYEAEPELSDSFLDNLVTDPKWGMGQEAFDYLMEKAAVNKNADSYTSSGNPSLDKVIDRTFSEPVTSDTYLVNSDCISNPDEVTMPSPIKSVIYLKPGARVEALVVTPEDYAVFDQLVNKYSDGSDMFASFPVTYVVNNKEVTFMAVVIKAQGCGNSVRLPRPEDVPTPTPTPTPPNPTNPPVRHKHRIDNGVGGPAVPPTVETPADTPGAPEVAPPPAVRPEGDPDGGSGDAGTNIEKITGDDSDKDQVTVPVPTQTPGPVCGTGNPDDC